MGILYSIMEAMADDSRRRMRSRRWHKTGGEKREVAEGGGFPIDNEKLPMEKGHTAIGLSRSVLAAVGVRRRQWTEVERSGLGWLFFYGNGMANQRIFHGPMGD